MRSFEPVRKRVPKIPHEDAVELIRRDWMKPDGTLISEEEAATWAWTFFLYLESRRSAARVDERRRLEPAGNPGRVRVVVVGDQELDRGLAARRFDPEHGQAPGLHPHL